MYNLSLWHYRCLCRLQLIVATYPLDFSSVVLVLSYVWHFYGWPTLCLFKSFVEIGLNCCVARRPLESLVVLPQSPGGQQAEQHLHCVQHISQGPVPASSTVALQQLCATTRLETTQPCCSLRLLVALHWLSYLLRQVLPCWHSVLRDPFRP